MLVPVLTRFKLPPIEDPTRCWRGVTPDGLPVLRLALFADCAWREMEGWHGPHHGPGWPQVAGETLIAQHGVGLEVSVVTVAGVGQLPGTEVDLVHYLRLTGPPDVLLLQTGAAHYTRRLFPSTEQWDRYRNRSARILGRHALTVKRLKDPVVKRFRPNILPYPGPATYAPFFAAARSAFPDAALAAIPVYPRLRHYHGDRETERMLHADLRAACVQAGVEVLDLAPLLEPHGQSARCLNRLNLNTLGTRIAGEHLAAWLFERSRVPA
jgi:hypothetical protein